MSEYDHTIDLNGSRYELNDAFRESLEERARLEYKKNNFFTCWWKRDEPTLVIETAGYIVPWDDMDQLEAEMMEPEMFMMRVRPPDDDDPENIDEGGGGMTVPPEDKMPEDDDREDIFGRTHFGLTPHRYEEVPSPEGQDPDKIPQKPERLDEESLVMWIPRHPDTEHSWETGEAIAAMDSWVEWDVQLRADQPTQKKDDTHDRFESLVRLYDCEKVGEYTPNDQIPSGESGSVKRKGEESFENGRFGGNNWSV